MKFNSDRVLFVWGAWSALAAIVHATEDYYKILGVSQDAADIEIKKAFRKLAVKYHPDKNKQEDAQAEFVKIAKAYEVLSDPQKKQNYDQFGEDASEDSKFSVHEFFKVFDDHYRRNNAYFAQGFSQNDHQQADSFHFEYGRTFDFPDLFNGPGDEGILNNFQFGGHDAKAAPQSDAKFKQGGFHNGQTCRTVVVKVGTTLTTRTICL